MCRQVARRDNNVAKMVPFPVDNDGSGKGRGDGNNLKHRFALVPHLNAGEKWDRQNGGGGGGGDNGGESSSNGDGRSYGTFGSRDGLVADVWD